MRFATLSRFLLVRNGLFAGLLSALIAAGCSSDATDTDDLGGAPNSGGTKSSGGTKGSGGSNLGGETGDGGSNLGGGGATGTGGTADPGVSTWIVGTWLTNPDGEYIGLLSVVDDLSAEGELDLDEAEDWPTDFTYSSPGGGVVYVGRDDSPVIERWTLNNSGELENTAEPPLGLAAYGVTSTLGRSQPVIQVIDENRAYYVDIENFQVIVFNPSTTPMTVYPSDTFSIDGLEEEGEWPQISVVKRDGDRLLVVGRYWDAADDTATALVRVAIIDTADNSVEYANDTRCGNIGDAIVDDDGNVYFGSHSGLAVSTAYGGNDAESPPSCVVRMKKGESEFDSEYFVNLEEISDGGVVGSLQQGVDNHAYVMQYTGDEEITAENWRAVIGGSEWEAHVFDLTDPENTYAKLDGFPKASGYASSFRTTIGHEKVTFLVWSDPEGGGRYYDVSNPTAPEAALEFESGLPGSAIAVETK